MTFSRFSVEPIVPTFQVGIGSDIYIIYIQSGSRSSVIHSCRKYWNRAAKVPVVPVSSSLTLVSISGSGRKAVSQLTYFPMYRLAEVEVAALYPGIREVTPNCRYQGCFKITDNGRPPELPLCILKLEKYTRTFQCLYPYINNRLLAPACPPQRHGW
ncbi:conserved hypothetical protein [Trichinella spiralis]|uniref:hypothetical protein n=1 Tax=Trichinella spiralis TaxID=6334 RepID=UPI0001EFBD94|nr:conserved hypothetical protein [Trichinella spiralis]